MVKKLTTTVPPKKGPLSQGLNNQYKKVRNILIFVNVIKPWPIPPSTVAIPISGSWSASTFRPFPSPSFPGPGWNKWKNDYFDLLHTFLLTPESL